MKTVVTATILLGGAATPLLARQHNSGSRPNILLIMVDDLGYETLGCYGGTSYATPNLDRLAKGGMQFENCHSTPKCSPSRVTIMTGQYTFRTTTKWGHIPKDEVTFGSVLASAGYETALAGKWQMALLKNNPKHLAQMGFEESCVWAWHEGPRYWKPMVYRNDKIMKGIAGRYGPDVFTEFLIAFMQENKGRPFLAYYPMCLTHFPKTH
jgi:arylsulfatase A